MTFENILAAFEASGLDELYRDMAERASRGDAWALDLVSDAIRARALRVAGLESFEAMQRRRAIAERADYLDCIDFDD